MSEHATDLKKLKIRSDRGGHELHSPSRSHGSDHKSASTPSSSKSVSSPASSDTSSEQKHTSKFALGKGPFNSGAIGRKSGDENILLEFSPADLGALSNENLLLIWRHYDRKSIGHLTAKTKEFEKLADHVVDRIETVYRSDFIKANPSMTDPEKIERELEKERAYIMPGGGKDRSKNVADMRSFIFRSMDINRDGKLTQQEFSLSWNSTMGPLFVFRQDSAGGCLIA